VRPPICQLTCRNAADNAAILYAAEQHCCVPAVRLPCGVVCARRSLLNNTVQRKPPSAANPDTAGSTGSPARLGVPVRNRPALVGEHTQTQPSAHLVGQRHISTEQAEGSPALSGSTGTHPGLRSWPRSSGASEDAASIKRRLLLNHSAVRQVRPVRRVSMRVSVGRPPLLYSAVVPLLIALHVWWNQLLGQDNHYEDSGRVAEPEIRPEDSARWRAMEKWATSFIGQQRKELNRMVRITVEPRINALELASACLAAACAGKEVTLFSRLCDAAGSGAHRQAQQMS
jgi:hypothetical protein